MGIEEGSVRPCANCQHCGSKFLGARVLPFCGPCMDGQTYMLETAPAGFQPVVSRDTLKKKDP
jgi:hypothetical protein